MRRTARQASGPFGHKAFSRFWFLCNLYVPAFLLCILGKTPLVALISSMPTYGDFAAAQLAQHVTCGRAMILGEIHPSRLSVTFGEGCPSQSGERSLLPEENQAFQIASQRMLLLFTKSDAQPL